MMSATTRNYLPRTVPAMAWTAAPRKLLQRKCAQDLEVETWSLAQRASAGLRRSVEVPPIVDEVLRSSGQGLDRETRTFMEARLGHDFSRVRVHTDARSAESARAVNAHAYTVGQEVVFGAGRYAPRVAEGQKLLAHELVHVVQQSKAPASGKLELDTSLEAAAEAGSNMILGGHPGVVVDRSRSQSLARQQASYPEVKQQVLDELNRNMPVAILGILDGLDAPTRNSLGSDPEVAQAVAKLPPLTRNTIRKHMVEGKAISKGEDPRDRVQPTERAAFDSLRAFLRDITQRIRQLVGKGSSQQAWINQGNANVQSLLVLLNGLVADLDAELIIVSFDQAAQGNVGASYDYLNDVMHLRPFTDDASRAFVAARLVHEYAHVKQDRTMESSGCQQSGAH